MTRPFSFLLTGALLVFTAGTALGQDVPGLRNTLQAALSADDGAAALSASRELHTAATALGDAEAAGFAAYAEASILERSDDSLAAAEAYQRCGQHYARHGSDAQALQCDYKSALAHQRASRSGTARKQLETIAKRLEAIGQDRSAFASQVYLKLAEDTAPSKSDRSRTAQRLRRETARLADRAIAALRASDLTQTADLPAAFYVKGMALEDAERYEDASAAYQEALSLYADLPDADARTLSTMRSRLGIANTEGRGSSGKQTVTIERADAPPVTLTIKRRKSVRFPKLDGNRLVDGARASVRIQLGASGRPDSVTITDSYPDPAFGQALKTAVETWRFTADDDTALETLPAFEYGMTFFVRAQ